jgi:hypothetical protein
VLCRVVSASSSWETFFHVTTRATPTRIAGHHSCVVGQEIGVELEHALCEERSLAEVLPPRNDSQDPRRRAKRSIVLSVVSLILSAP